MKKSKFLGAFCGAIVWLTVVVILVAGAGVAVALPAILAINVARPWGMLYIVEATAIVAGFVFLEKKGDDQ